jgi:hypothetical protein
MTHAFSSEARRTQTGQPLARYRVHFVDHSETVFDATVIEHDMDDEAIKHAHRLDVASIGAGFDIIDEGRLVHRHRR